MHTSRRPDHIRTAVALSIVALFAMTTSCGGDDRQVSTAVEEGGACSTEGAQTGMANGTLECHRDEATGELRWVALGGDGADGGAGGGAPDPKALRVGTSCPTEGLIGFADGMVTMCDTGTVRYALPDDLPAAPASGYTERPEWYPSLAEIFGSGVEDCPSGAVSLTHTPLPAEHITRTIPAGMMIGNHVTPIDHMYIGIDTLEKDPSTLTDDDFVPVVASGDGMIVDAGSLGAGGYRVVIVHGCNIISVYMVVNRLSGVLADIAAGIDSGSPLDHPIPVKAGDEFGQQRDSAMDFNIFDGTTWLTGLANPFSYANGEPWKPYTADPARVFTPETWSVINSSMQRTDEPRWGKLDNDVIGSASGSWFLDGTIGYNGLLTADVADARSMLPGGQVPGKHDYSWSHLSLSPHPVDTSSWIFSTGAWADPDGDPQQFLLLADGVPAPDELTAADGVVAYRLAPAVIVQPADFQLPEGSMAPAAIGYTLQPGPETAGWALVRVVDDAHLEIEVFRGDGPAPTGFGADPQTYHR